MSYPTYFPAYQPQFSPQMGRTDFMGQGYPQAAQMPQNGSVAQPQAFQTRPVTGREEAVAMQVDFLGPGTLMPDLAHGKVYLKRFNQNTGASDLLTFTLETPEAVPEQPLASPGPDKYATKEDVRLVREVIRGIAAELDEFKRMLKGVERSESNE